MENIGLNNEVVAGGKTFHVQTQYLEPSEKVVANVFDNGKVIFSKGVDVKSFTASDIKHHVNQLHQNTIADIELIYYISDKVHTIRHCASTNKLGIIILLIIFPPGPITAPIFTGLILNEIIRGACLESSTLGVGIAFSIAFIILNLILKEKFIR